MTKPTSSTSLAPGAILWLPQRTEIDSDKLDAFEVYSTIPERCFGHPVLVLNGEEPNNCVTILILTSFQGGKEIHGRIKSRGHELQHYVPVHPAPALDNTTPTLRLTAPHEFNRKIWANIFQSYRCHKSWLQRTWRTVWKRKERGGKIEQSSLVVMATYAARQGYDPLVYKTFLAKHTTPSVTLRPPPPLPPARVEIPIGHRTHKHAVVSTPPAARRVLFQNYRHAGHVPQPVDRLCNTPSEREPLLPRTNSNYRRSPARNQRLAPSGPRGLQLLFIMVVITLVIAVLCIVCIAVGSIFVSRLGKLAREKSETASANISRGVGKGGHQLGMLWGKFVAWWKGGKHIKLD